MAFLWKKLYAFFYDDNGEYITRVRIKRWEKLFKYKNRSYNIVEDEATISKVSGIFHDRWYYHYNINNPNPLLLDKKAEPILNSEVYNVQLETKVARDLNELNNNGLSQYLTPRNIIIGLIVIGVIIYFATGNKLLGH